MINYMSSDAANSYPFREKNSRSGVKKYKTGSVTLSTSHTELGKLLKDLVEKLQQHYVHADNNEFLDGQYRTILVLEYQDGVIKVSDTSPSAPSYDVFKLDSTLNNIVKRAMNIEEDNEFNVMSYSVDSELAHMFAQVAERNITAFLVDVYGAPTVTGGPPPNTTTKTELANQCEYKLTKMAIDLVVLTYSKEEESMKLPPPPPEGTSSKGDGDGLPLALPPPKSALPPPKIPHRLKDN